jgi:hypothetical protein
MLNRLAIAATVTLRVVRGVLASVPRIPVKLLQHFDAISSPFPARA